MKKFELAFGILLIILLSVLYNHFALKPHSLPDIKLQEKAPAYQNHFQSKVYYHIDEFFSRYPHQKELHDIFLNRVQSPVQKREDIRSRKIRIEVVYPGNQLSDYWRRSVSSMKKRLDEHNIAYEVTESFFGPNMNDLRKQEELLKKLYKKGPDYLVCTLDFSKHKKMIEFFLRMKTTKVIIQNVTTPLRDWEAPYGIEPLQYVGFDHITGTNILANQFINKIGTQGKYAVLFASKGYISQMRGDSFIHYINQHSQLQLVASYYTNIDSHKAKKATIEILKEHPDLDFIYACSTDIALGALEGIEEVSPRKKPIINGWGGGSRELEALQQGDLNFTVMRINDDNGIAMADTINMYSKGQAKEIPLVFSGELVLIEQGISKENLKALKNRAFRYSGPAK